MNTNQAVRELRQHLGESQQAFATRLGLSVRAIANYEKERKPAGSSLAQLLGVSRTAGRLDLAQVFAEALARELGYDAPGTVVTISGLHVESYTVRIKSDEKPHFEALLSMLRNPEQCRHELAQWKKIRVRIAEKTEGAK